MLAENGQTSPCLDFRLIASSLVQLTEREQVDLIVIEGMGRAIHCNLNAKFSVDTLKIAVIKNSWLARRLGGQLYSVIFRLSYCLFYKMLRNLFSMNGLLCCTLPILLLLLSALASLSLSSPSSFKFPVLYT
ncbi:unnamed protein product [Heterobilharzia americana]|nr:unnamed protein product [Heterobilharzia americana]